MTKKRILFYSHDALGLGHIRRTIAIAERIASIADSTALILTGTPVIQSFRLPRNVDFIKLPSLRKTANSSYEARNLQMGGGELFQLRSRIILETFQNYAPDIFVADKHPAGVMGELMPSLIANARRKKRARVVLSLRDILDEPDVVVRSWRSKGLYDVLRDYYDRILVWGMKEICDPIREYRFPSDVAAKVSFCGYIRRDVPGGKMSMTEPSDSRPLVVATAGGGEDGYFLLENFVRSLGHVREAFASVVLTGPDMPQADRARLHARMSPPRTNVFAVDFTNRVEEFFRSADVVVSMAGYNSVCEILAQRKKVILVPRVQPRQEQLIRARNMKALGIAEMIHPDELSPEILAETIDRLLAAPNSNTNGCLDFGGLDRAADIFERDLTQMQAAG